MNSRGLRGTTIRGTTIRETTIRGNTIRGNRWWPSQWVSCLPIWVTCADLDLVGHLLHSCATNVTACERDEHLLLPLLLVLFSVAHLHCRKYAVHMNNSYLPLVCIPCSIPPCHWKTSCQLSKCPLAVISCRGGDTKECHSSRPAQ